MTKNQRKIIIVGVLVMVLMGLFPPWVKTFNYKTAHSRNPAGYSFILAPPTNDGRVVDGVEIDFARLSVQWLVVALLAGLGVFLVSGRKDEDREGDPA